MRDQREQEERKSALQNENVSYGKYISAAKMDMAKFVKAQEITPEGEVLNRITLDGFEVPEGVTVGTEEYDKCIGERLLSIDKTARTADCYIPIGDIYGFRILVKSRETGYGEDGAMGYENRFFVEGTEPLKYSYNDGYLNHVSARISGGMMLKALQELPRRIGDWEKRVADNEVRIEQLADILTAVWPKEDELKKARAELGILDRKIAEDLKKSETEEGQRQAA
jgi:uncharacterized coiled-coil protein SlyX